MPTRGHSGERSFSDLENRRAYRNPSKPGSDDSDFRCPNHQRRQNFPGVWRKHISDHLGSSSQNSTCGREKILDKKWYTSRSLVVWSWIAACVVIWFRGPTAVC